MKKIGRNDPCPCGSGCGSGKKYKKCCLNNDEKRIREAKRPYNSEEFFEDEIMPDNEVDFELDQEGTESGVEESNIVQGEREPFHSKTISKEIPEISEQEQTLIDEWWRQYKQVKMQPDMVIQHLESFFIAHPSLVPNIEFHHDILFELSSQMVREGEY